MTHELSQEQLEQNKAEFISLLKGAIKDKATEGKDIIDYLERSDFFEAPASTKYHNSIKGGLCQHSLNVYKNLLALCESKKLVKVYNIENDEPVLSYGVIDYNSIVIVGLLHDISKTNFYEKTIFNKKVYFDDGIKCDEYGRYNWISVQGYKVKDDKFVYGNHELTSEYMIRRFINLTYKESVAIINHHGGMSDDSIKSNVPETYSNNPLSLMLHIADLMASYIDEAAE